MKRFLIEVSTGWAGMEDTYRAKAEDTQELLDIAESLAYENYLNYGCEEYVVAELGYDIDNISESDWIDIFDDISESEYYFYTIIEFTGSDEEWEEIGGEIYEPGKY